MSDVISIQARDALSPHVVRTTAATRPPQLWKQRQAGVVYAVFAERQESDPTEELLGLVAEREAALHPGRNFEEFLPPSRPEPVPADAPLEDVLRRMNVDAAEFVPVVDASGRFLGSVTRTSLLGTLLRHQYELLLRLKASQGSTADADRQGTWTAGLLEMHSAGRSLLNLLVGTTLEKDFFQGGIDTIKELLRPDFAAVVLVNDAGEVLHWASAGEGLAGAERLGNAVAAGTPLGEALRGNRVYHWERSEGLEFPAGLAFLRDEVTSLLALPIFLLGREYGAVYLYNDHRTQPFGVEDEILASTFAHILALLFHQAHERAARQALEAQLRQAQKMEAVGRLAGGVAHDFNNLLTIICGYTDLMIASSLVDGVVRENLVEVQKAAEQAATLTRQLLSLSRRQVLQPRVLDLNHVIRDMERLIARMVGEAVEVTFALDEGLHAIKADMVQIKQILLNLASNARDAMPGGGRLFVETANIRMDDIAARFRVDVPPGAYALLRVRDTGHGMSEETKAHLFEPFFTTKDVGQGTGLGLATVYSAVKQAGGFIDVESELGQGAAFRIYLPQVDASGAPLPMPPPIKDIPLGTETVLLVEDDPAVRTLARHILAMKGFTVIEARDGIEALRAQEAHGGPVHLLLTDIVMPQLGGKQLAERILQVRPATKVLFFSGHTEESLVRSGVAQEGLAFLSKPFTPEGLVRKVREVLYGK